MCRVVLMGYFTWSPFPRKFSSFSRHNSNGADSPKTDEKIVIVGQLQRVAMSPFAATVQRADDFFGNVLFLPKFPLVHGIAVGIDLNDYISQHYFRLFLIHITALHGVREFCG